jgi:hypothetical protein
MRTIITVLNLAILLTAASAREPYAGICSTPTFEVARTFSAGTNGVNFTAVGDFNGDGKPDLAVATGEGVSVLLGKGDGTLQSAVHLARH